MQNTMRNRLLILNYMTNSEKLKGAFVVSIILCLYGSLVLGVGASNFSDSILTAFQFPIYNIFAFGLIFYINFSMCSIFNKEFHNYAIRLETKKKYYKELVILTVIFNTYYMLIISLLFVSFLMFSKFGLFSVSEYHNYGISNFKYMLYYMARYFTILVLLSTISTLLYEKSRQFMVLIVDCLIIFGFLFSYLAQNSEVWHTLLWSYFSNSIYTSFTIEVLYSMGFIVFLIMLVMFLFYRLVNNKGGNLK